VVQTKVDPVSKHRVITTYGWEVKIKTNVFHLTVTWRSDISFKLRPLLPQNLMQQSLVDHTAAKRKSADMPGIESWLLSP